MLLGEMRLTLGLAADGAEGCSALGVGGKTCCCCCECLGRAMVWVGRARDPAAVDVEKASEGDGRRG